MLAGGGVADIAIRGGISITNYSTASLWLLEAQQIRLGIFFLVSLAVLALFFIVVAGSHLLSQRDTYYIEFTDMPISGLNKGASVKYLGLSIGRIEDISIAQTTSPLW